MTSQSPKVFESEVLIRFPDCDPFNHLNNSKYIDYFINAREDHLREHGFDMYRYALEKGLAWVVVLNQVAYLKPAVLNEMVNIESTLLLVKDKEVLIEMRMWDKNKTVLKSLLWSKCLHYDLKTQRAVNHSTELMDFFKPFEDPLTQPIGFEERLTELKNKQATPIR